MQETNRHGAKDAKKDYTGAQPVSGAQPCDAVLLIAFGGPTRMEEVRPFLDHVVRGRPIPRSSA